MELDITTGLRAVLKPKKKLWPSHVNRISSLDDDCLRKLYYYRVDWDKQEEISDYVQGIFETGNILEPVNERIISEIGMANSPRFRVVGSQMPTKDTLLEKYKISGHIDGLLQIEQDGRFETVAVMDGKTMDPNIFRAINSYDDLAKYQWTRKYRGQLKLYALAHNLEWCCLLCVNKSNLYDIKPIFFPIDMDYCEGLLNKADTINRAVDAKKPPQGVNDAEHCDRCPFRSHCGPDLTRGRDLTISDSEELQGVLARLEDLAPYEEEIKAQKKVLDQLLSKGNDIMCGDWMITWKKSIQSRKATEAKAVEVWRKKIVKVGS